MVCTDRTDRLAHSFRLTTELLTKLLDGLKQRRTHWASAVASTLAPSPQLEQVSRDLALEEQGRAALLAEILAELPAVPHLDPADLHVNISRICKVLPTRPSLELRRAADDATRLAKQVRVEVALGERLLRFTQRANDNLLTALQGGEHTGLPSGYDRNARSRAGLGLGSVDAGKLVDGRI